MNFDREYYIRLRNQYLPKNLKVIFILESPPSSGKYFYDIKGSVLEPLFSYMMKCVINFNPINKKEGIRKFCEECYFLVDATYTPVDKLTDTVADKIIIENYPKLVEDLRNIINRKKVKIILVKSNVCKLLEKRLLNDGFEVINNKKIIPFPSHGWQKIFCKRIEQLLKKEV